MSRAQQRLQERRAQLVADAASQRTALRRELARWQPPLALADQGLTALRYVRQHWPMVIAGTLLIGVLRPARLGLWLGRAWVATRLLYRLRLAGPIR